MSCKWLRAPDVERSAARRLRDPTQNLKEITKKKVAQNFWKKMTKRKRVRQNFWEERKKKEKGSKIVGEGTKKEGRTKLCWLRAP